MKKQTRSVLFAAAILGLAASCDKAPESSLGAVRLNLENDWEVSEATKSSVADFTALPAASQFSISVTDEQETATPVGDASQPVSLAAGNYTANAVFGSTSEEGWDKPCFEGSQSFSVQGGETTDVTITVRLANCIVRVETTPQFRNYYSDWNFQVVSGAGTSVSFGKDETRAAFFDAYLINVSGTLTGQNGKTFKFDAKEYKNLEAATCYTLKFDVTNVGGAGITITFDDTTEDVELGSIEIND